MHKVLIVSLTAALISARLTGVAEAAYTERDVNRMEDLISAGNWVDLRIFLLSNPRFLNGSDAFTQQLQKFLDETDSLYTALTFDPSLFPNVTSATPTEPVRRVARAPETQQDDEPGTGTAATATSAATLAAPSANAAQSIY